MFGKTLKRYCTDCEKTVQHITTILYEIDGKDYTNSFNCPNCNKDLAVEDKEIIIKARNEGKSVSVVMC